MHAERTGQFPNGLPYAEQTGTMVKALREVQMVRAYQDQAQIDVAVELAKMLGGMAGALGARAR